MKVTGTEWQTPCCPACGALPMPTAFGVDLPLCSNGSCLVMQWNPHQPLEESQSQVRNALRDIANSDA